MTSWMTRSAVTVLLAAALCGAPLAHLEARTSMAASVAPETSCHDKASAHQKGLRLGAEIGVGAAMEDQVGLVVPLLFQLGIQFSKLWALFWQPSVWLGGFVSTAGDQADAYLMSGQLLMFDLTLAILQFGVGGGFDFGGVLGCRSTDNSCGVNTGIWPSLGARAALVIGFPHFRLPIALNYHATFLDSDVASQIALTIGLQIQ